jgi:hypothetical protein
VINRIEDEIIKTGAINRSNKGTLDKEQVRVDSVKTSDTFRGGTYFELTHRHSSREQQQDHENNYVWRSSILDCKTVSKQ